MIDTHCHLFKEYYDNIEEVINKMKNNIMIVSGTTDLENKEILDLCQKYNNVYGTLGIHPTELDKMTDNSLKLIEENINNPKIIGIGEIGLDYFWTKDNKELQKQLFIEQINLAKKYNKPIIVHSRDAINDTYEIVKQYAKGINVDIHCFSGSLEMANKFIEIGCRIGVGGVITFKNSSKLVEVVKNIDLNKILLETDSPYMTPEPLRGTKNEPYNIIYVARKIAEIKNIPVELVLKQTTDNAILQFDLDAKL